MLKKKVSMRLFFSLATITKSTCKKTFRTELNTNSKIIFFKKKKEIEILLDEKDICFGGRRKKEKIFKKFVCNTSVK